MSGAHIEPLHIGPELTIMHAEVHRQALLSALIDHPDGFALDLSQVSAMDSSGVQLLVALRRSLQARGQRLDITQASAAVQDVLLLYGMGSFIAAA